MSLFSQQDLWFHYCQRSRKHTVSKIRKFTLTLTLFRQKFCESNVIPEEITKD